MMPTPIMEAALRRRLLSRLKYTSLELHVDLVKGGGVSISHGTKPLGVWHWQQGMFRFTASGQDRPFVTAHTLMGATAHTLLQLEKSE